MPADRPGPEDAARHVARSRYPDADVVFLAGSVLRGEGTAYSDLDLVVVYAKVPRAFRESYLDQGWPIEAFVHDPATLRYFWHRVDAPTGVPSLASMVAEAVEIPAPTRLSQALQREAREYLKAGPPRWEDAERERARYAITDVCNDLRAPRNRSEMQASGARLYGELANFFCRARGAWSATGKSIPRRLQRMDADFAQRFQDSFRHVWEAGETRPVLELAEEILAPHGGFHFSSFRSDAPAHFRLEDRPSPATTDAEGVIAHLAEELQEAHSCHTVILYGSRARGDAGPSSDYDMMGIRTQGPEVVREARWENGAYLDLFIYSEDYVREHVDALLHVAGGRLVVDLQGVGKELLQRLNSLAQAPVQPLPADEAAARRVWAGKQLARARGGDAEGDYRRHWLLFSLLEDYFALRRLRYQGPKLSLHWLRQERPEVYRLFQCALAPAASWESLESLVQVVSSHVEG